MLVITCPKRWLDDAMQGNEVCDTSHISLYDDIEKLMEAAWLIWKKDKAVNKLPSRTIIDSFSAIKQLLMATIQPEYIFRLSHLRQTDRLDLLVVISATSAKPFSYYESIIDIACFGFQEVNISLHLSTEWKRHLEEGHIFYTTACTENNKVYENGSPRLLELTGKIAHEKLTASAQKWEKEQGKAGQFLMIAKDQLEKEENSMAAFMLHQATELAFRATICFFWNQEVKDHKIAVLKKYCHLCAGEICNLFPADTDEEKRLLDTLDKAYLEARYNEDYNIDRNTLYVLFSRVENAQKIAANLVKHALTNYE